MGFQFCLSNKDNRPNARLRGFERYEKKSFGLIQYSRFHKEHHLLIAFDGRLDHRAELCTRLHLPVDSGPEVIIAHAYLTWGNACPNYLNGDFSFTIWNEKTRQIFAARDAMGIRPLYFIHLDNREFAISTSLDFLAQTFAQCCNFNIQALAKFSIGEYDDRITPYKNIHGLDFGHSLTFGDDKLKIKRWWEPEQVPTSIHRNEQDYIESFLEIFDQSIMEHYRTDRSMMGSTMSGGLDSTSVTAKTKHLCSDKTIIPYSYKFNKLTDCDESGLSQLCGDFLDLQPRWVNCEEHWLFKNIATASPYSSLPFFSWESLDREILCDLKKRGGNVLLTGHGGDSMMTGTLPEIILGERLRTGHFQALKQLKKKGFSPIRSLYHYIYKPFVSTYRPWPKSKQKKHPIWLASSPFPTDKPSLYPESRQISRRIDRQSIYHMIVHNGSGIRRACHYLQNLADPFAIEYRHPFYDRKLAEFILATPPELLSRQPPKSFLRKAMRGLLPEEILSNTHKPLLHSFYLFGIKKELRAIRDLMKKGYLVASGVVDIQAFNKILNQAVNGESIEDRGSFMYAIMVEAWIRKRSG